MSDDPRSPRPLRTRGEGESSPLPLPSWEGLGGTPQRALCRLDALPDGGSKGFAPQAGGFFGLFAIRQGDVAYVYVNSCPHLGVPLDWKPDRFLSADGGRIVCATHGAEFRIADGECLRGPCFGDRLERIKIQIKDGTIYVPEDAGL